MIIESFTILILYKSSTAKVQIHIISPREVFVPGTASLGKHTE